MPSYKELLTLVDETPHTEYVDYALIEVWIDANAFPETAVKLEYWTSSMFPGNSLSAYTVDFGDGYGDRQYTVATLYVRCVHD